MSGFPRVFASVTAIALVTGLTGVAAAADKTTLRVASFLPKQSVSVRGALLPWMDGLSKEAGDVVDTKGFWGGSLGRNPTKYLDLVQDGVADAAIIIPGYTPGRFPGFSVAELPGLVRSGPEGGHVQWDMYRAGHFKGFEKVHVVGLFATDVYQIHSSKELKSAGDIKGLKIRAAGPVMASTIEYFGGVPVAMPLPKVPEALNRGVIDGLLGGFAQIGIFRMQTIAKSHFDVPLGTTAIVTIMNKNAYDKLPAKAKNVSAKYGGYAMANTAGRVIDGAASKFKGQMKSSKDHNFIDANKTDMQNGQVAFKDVHAKWIAETENGQKMYDDFIKYLAAYRAKN